ncbi:type IV pilus assembly protein PilM [Desulforamulus reducens MI-1]|uniref:Type IV pilus assembly protein PilM n=1 Tax=Desulforamulus reducens (strain ATCC BAA-1160 / DSM 100696 / MI-1) TaxID=349161 RepID=A4J3B9_DESRM|nr:type IV pilus assembly protein PilM [Desulforamulus reducens]ABO49572.1 type IV pilus assembly protein PilM [Desulforamulus reducens MI-1]
MAFFKPAGAVGLQIDTGIIRVVELKGTARFASLVTAGQIDIPDHAVVDGIVVDVQTVAQAIRDLWERHNIKDREVVLGICNQGVFMRYTTFPKIPDKKLAQALRFQAGEYFPIDNSQLVFDYAVLGEDKKANNIKLKVLLVAARKDLLDISLRTLEAAHLQPKVVDISYLALLRTLTREQLSDSLVLVDLANGLTTIQLVHEGIPRFSRVISHSLQSYAREVNVPLADENLTSLPLVAATEEVAARSYTGFNTPEDWSTTLANEIRSSVSYYLAQANAGSVEIVILSGRGARISGLAERLQEELGVRVEVLYPLKNLQESLQSNGLGFADIGTDFTSCIGLALRGLGE